MPQAADPEGGGAHRVVIVDDRPDVRLLLSTRLSLEPGIEVVGEGGTGGDAIAAARELRPDLMILDLNMPGMSGTEALPVIRGIAPLMRILVYSGEPEAFDLVGATRPDAIARKGRDLNELVSTVKRLLAEKPSDIVHVEVGEVALAPAVAAFDSWVGLNVRIPEVLSQPGKTLPEPLERLAAADAMALTGILLTLGDQLVRAAQDGSSTVNLALDVRPDIGRAAAGALQLIGSEASMAMFEDTWEYVPTPAAMEAMRLLYERLSAALA